MIIRSLLLLIVLTQAPGGLQVPAPPGAADAPATARIKGRVTATDSGRPLRRARITVSGGPLTSTRSTSTNARGEFEIKDLPAGRFTVTVQRAGYLRVAYGQRLPTEPGRPVVVGEGQVLEGLDFAMRRSGIVTGRVVDETGEPVADVSVFLMRQEFFRGARRVVPASSLARTDDTGQYRLLDVPPGEYYVLASHRETWTAGPKRETFGYAPSYYPSVSSLEHAMRVKVGLGQETPNIDINLVTARAASLSGTVMRGDGTPMPGARVSLSLEMTGATGGMSMGIASATAGQDGSWQLRNITPGEYQLDATLQDRGRFPERASMTILVNGADIGGVMLTAESGGTIRGTIVTDDGVPFTPANTRLRVSADSVGGRWRNFQSLAGDDNGQVGSDGRFTFTGVAGQVALRVFGLPPGYTVRGVERDGMDISNAPIQVGDGKTMDVQVVVTNRLPMILARLTDDRGAPAEGVALLFPADQALWFDESRLRSARPDSSGLTRFDHVLPGDYLAVALPTVTTWQVRDPAFLEGLRDTATPVTVREGMNPQLELKVGGN